MKTTIQLIFALMCSVSFASSLRTLETNSLQLSGSTSGSLNIQAPASADGTSWTLPNTGASGLFLTQNGSGVMSWLYPPQMFVELLITTATTVTTTLGTVGTLTTTPSAGTWKIDFSGAVTGGVNAGATLTVQLYVDSTAQGGTARTLTPFSAAALSVFQAMPMSINKIITVTGTNVVTIKAQSSSGNFTLNSMVLDAVRIQ